MAATRVKSQDIKDGEVLVGDIGAAAVTFVKLNLAANPGLEDSGAGATRVKVAAPITLGAAGVGVSDFTSGANNPGVRGTVPAPVLGDITKFLRGDGTWAAPTGGVTGPGSSTDHAVVRWDGTGGNTLLNITIARIDDNGNLALGSTGNTFGAATYYSACFGSTNAIATNVYGSLALGDHNNCNSSYCLAVGSGAKAEHFAEFVLTSGYNLSAGTVGSVQFTINVLMGYTANAVAKEIFLGSGGRFTLLASGVAYSCFVMVQARKTGGGGASMFRQLLIERNGNTTQLVGAVQTVGVDINASGYAITLTADDTNDSLKVQVTGAGTDSLDWIVTILATKLLCV